jgi:flagellar hook-length control protein FliK
MKAHKVFEEATERDEAIKEGNDKLIPLAAAIIAVLAALGTLFAHHRSIQALSEKNEAIILTARSADRYAYYQSQRTRVTLYNALLSAGIVKDLQREKALRAVADREERASLANLAQAQTLERESIAKQEHAETILASFETLEVATTLFEIAIVFTSISALTNTRVLLWAGVAMSAIGLALGIAGYFQG